MRRLATLMLCFGLAVGLAMPPAFAGSRIKDVASFQAARDNQLIGYGLVVGLAGTGDSLRNAPFTESAARSMLDNLGIATSDGATRVQNIASVIVTADLPPFMRTGSRIDVTVSSLGDATSLAGGQLVMTPLSGPDATIYAVAQGPVSIGGFLAEGDAESVQQGTPTTGRIINGAIVEQEIPSSLAHDKSLVLQLRNPDFTTAIGITDAINREAGRLYGIKPAHEIDAKTVTVSVPKGVTTARFISDIENLIVDTQTAAKVILDERTGTVVIGNDVRILPVAVSHGTLTVRITELPEVSQPAPFSDGETVVVPRTLVDVAPAGDVQLGVVRGADLQEVVTGLNSLGVAPRDVIAILQTIQRSGALQAELVVQ